MSTRSEDQKFGRLFGTHTFIGKELGSTRRTKRSAAPTTAATTTTASLSVCCEEEELARPGPSDSPCLVANLLGPCPDGIRRSSPGLTPEPSGARGRRRCAHGLATVDQGPRRPDLGSSWPDWRRQCGSGGVRWGLDESSAG
jgi:hypothetical protein